MNSFSSRVLMAFIVPGFIFLLLLVSIPSNDAWSVFMQALKKGEIHDNLISPSVVIASFAMAFLAGGVSDAIRNKLGEPWVDKFYQNPDRKWLDYFFRGEKDKVQQLDDFYYSYYQFDVNSSILIVIFECIRIWTITVGPYSCDTNFFIPLWAQIIFPILIAVILLWDAKSLRGDMYLLIMEVSRSIPSIPPTCNVRVVKSSIQGIGVKAIKDIKKGTELFPNDDGKLIWVDESQLMLLSLSKGQWKLYYDFCIFKGNRCGCPLSFDNLTPAWYLNKPLSDQQANAECVERDGGFFFYAKYNISDGTEITADYSTFSDDAWDWLKERAGV